MINNEFQLDLPNTFRVPVHYSLIKLTSCCTRIKHNTLLKLFVATSSVFVVQNNIAKNHTNTSYQKSNGPDS